MPHTKFTSIESFANVFRHQQRFHPPAVVEYGGKIKLHGTNAAVRIEPDKSVWVQGRNRDLSAEDDQFGFYSWVAPHIPDWEGMHMEGQTVLVHGEWAGPGVQRKDAVTMLDQKYFFVFAIQVDDVMLVEPDEIERLVPDLDNLLVLPWHIQMVEPAALDFDNRTSCSVFSEWVADLAEEIGEEDPFIKDIFGVEGPGEGLVFVPRNHNSRDMYGSLTFKAKAERHREKKTKKAAGVVAEIPQNIVEFVEAFVTEPRLEQAVSEACGGEIDPKKTGDFLKWIGQDVHKESQVELEESGLEWKQVQKHVTNAALKWWKPQLAKIV